MSQHSLWSEQFGEGVKRWCEHVATLSVDVLIDAGLVRRDEFHRARDIVAEEVLVRLCLLDYPPVPASLREPPAD